MAKWTQLYNSLNLWRPKKATARGQYIIGIDFDQPETRILAIPVRAKVPLWHHAEIVSKEAFEDLIEAVRTKARTAGDKAAR